MVEYIACQVCTNVTFSPYIPKTLAAPSRARAELSFLKVSQIGLAWQGLGSAPSSHSTATFSYFGGGSRYAGVCGGWYGGSCGPSFHGKGSWLGSRRLGWAEIRVFIKRLMPASGSR